MLLVNWLAGFTLAFIRQRDRTIRRWLPAGSVGWDMAAG